MIISKPIILAFDQGTTSTRAIIFNEEGHILGMYQMPHRQIYPNPGWVSHDAEEIFDHILETGQKAMERANVQPSDIAAIGLTNQRETLVMWDKRTGKPIGDAIVWQCRRTVDICAQMERDGMESVVRQKTGLLIDPYFSATKIKWMLNHYPQAMPLMQEGHLLAGTMDSFIIWRLTGGKRHVTDYTNASRTMLFNIKALNWDADLLKYFGIDPGILPEVFPSVGEFGRCEKVFWGMEAPITGVAGDQHAALFGQTCLQAGDVKNTYGTGCFILKNIGTQPLIAPGKLLTTIAWHMNGQTTYALEGSIFNAGAAVEWMMKEMGWADSVEAINDICQRTPDTDGVYVVPAFSGLGAPYWDMYARGTICGMNLSTNKRHMVRAVMESIAFQSKDVIDHMENISGLHLPVLRVDGGVCKSDFVMQFQADLLQVPVDRPKHIETTALGVFYMAGLGVGLFKEEKDLQQRRETEKQFVPQASAALMEERYRLWQKAVQRAEGWLRE